MDTEVDLLDQFEVGGTFFELIEFSLHRKLNNGKNITGVYGVNVAKVREVVHMPLINPLASSIPGVAGIFELRGVPIPAINLCQVLGDSYAPLSDTQQIIVTEFSEKRAGFIVSTTHRIRRVAWEKVLPPSSDQDSCMSGMILVEDNSFLFILDLEKILSDLEHSQGGNGSFSPYANNFGQNQQIPSGSAPLEADLLASANVGVSYKHDFNAPGIMIVDDSNLVLNNMERSLKQKGYRVLRAPNGAEALDKLHNMADTPDISFGELNCLITDVEMPLMDGLTLVKKVREDERFNGMPILLHTSLSGDVTQNAASTVGANGYIVKNDVRNLLDVVEEILNEMKFSLGK